MKKTCVGLLVACMLCAISGQAAEMITNEDLERRFRTEDPAESDESKGRRWIYERSRVENECAELKAAVDQARRTAYDDSDPSSRNDRKAHYMSVKQQYLNRCTER